MTGAATQFPVGMAAVLGTPGREGMPVALPVPDGGLAPARILGEAAYLAMRSADHRELSVAELEALLVPAIELKQFRLWRTGDAVPVAFAAWALADDAVAARLAAGERRMGLGDWRSGGRWTLVDLIAPFGGRGGFLAQLSPPG